MRQCADWTEKQPTKVTAVLHALERIECINNEIGAIFARILEGLPDEAVLSASEELLERIVGLRAKAGEKR